jgi:hypothetical protein
MGLRKPSAQGYLMRVWTLVVLRMIIDAVAALLVLAVVVLLAFALVAVAGRSLGVTYLHIRQAAGILGGIYVAVIWVRTLRRHWIIAGHVKDEKSGPKPETPEVPEVSHAGPSSTSST